MLVSHGLGLPSRAALLELSAQRLVPSLLQLVKKGQGLDGCRVRRDRRLAML